VTFLKRGVMTQVFFFVPKALKDKYDTSTSRPKVDASCEYSLCAPNLSVSINHVLKRVMKD
jgi:hypothetical protein